MTTQSLTHIYETDAYGCHITLEELRPGIFHATVSYPVYNTRGEHVASPQWGTVGTGGEVYLFVLKTIARAVKVNHRTLDIDMLLVTGVTHE